MSQIRSYATDPKTFPLLQKRELHAREKHEGGYATIPFGGIQEMTKGNAAAAAVPAKTAGNSLIIAGEGRTARYVKGTGAEAAAAAKGTRSGTSGPPFQEGVPDALTAKPTASYA